MSIDRPVALLAIGQVLVWASLFYVFPASLLRFEQEFGWTKSELTLGITIAVLLSGFAAPLAGHVIDRGWGGVQMAASAALGGLALVGVSFVRDLWEFYLLWSIMGVCFAGCLYEPCFALVTRARGAKAKNAITLITLIAGFAGSLSFPTMHLLTEWLGLRSALLCVGMFVTFVVAPILMIGAQALGPAQFVNQTGAQARQYLRLPSFWLLGTGFALAGFAHGATLHHLLPLLAERQVAPHVAVMVAATIGPMQVVGRVLMVATQSRVSTHMFCNIAFLAIAMSLAFLALSGGSIPLIFLFVALFGASYGTVSILRPVVARELLGGENFGAKSGGLALIYLTASAASAYIGAVLWTIGGYDLMLQVLIGSTVLGVTCYVLARRFA